MIRRKASLIFLCKKYVLSAHDRPVAGRKEELKKKKTQKTLMEIEMPIPALLKVLSSAIML